jgi:TRAP-type C4-dicarboxylate transport system substrate-binding protein
MFRKLLVMVGAAAFVLAQSTESEAGTTLKIGTLAPQGSPWASAFSTFASQVNSDTGGEVTLDFRFSYGDEVRMVGDIRSGQLDGAAITAVGLGQIYKDVLIFQLPGLFSNWGKLDAARNAMKGQLEAEFEKQGFKILGWGDVGAAKIMSMGFDIKRPSDLSGKGCYFLAGDPIGPVLFSKIGGVTPKQVSVPEILPGLNNGSINVLFAPPLAAEQLQWASKVDHINTMTAGFGIGAIVVSSTKHQSIPEQHRNTLASKGKETGDKLTQAIRNADAQAFARLKTRKTAYEPTDDEKKEWRKLMDDTRSQLRGSVFTASVFDQVVNLAK